MASASRRASNAHPRESRPTSAASTATTTPPDGAKPADGTDQSRSRRSSSGSQASRSSRGSHSSAILARRPSVHQDQSQQKVRTPIVVVIRHAQAMHNIPPKDLNLPDPPLTKLGHMQASSVAEAYPWLYWMVQAGLATVMSSPFIRALQTTHLAFPFLKPGQVLKSQDLQEVCDQPANTGSAVKSILAAMGTQHKAHHYANLEEDWFNKVDDYASTEEAQLHRALKVRLAVRKLPSEIVVLVSHGGFMPYLCEDRPWKHGDKWPNVQAKVFRFASDSDERARLILGTDEEQIRYLGEPKRTIPRTF